MLVFHRGREVRRVRAVADDLPHNGLGTRSRSCLIPLWLARLRVRSRVSIGRGLTAAVREAMRQRGRKRRRKGDRRDGKGVNEGGGQGYVEQ